jgi:hypothetical protein
MFYDEHHVRNLPSAWYFDIPRHEQLLERGWIRKPDGLYWHPRHEPATRFTPLGIARLEARQARPRPALPATPPGLQWLAEWVAWFLPRLLVTIEAALTECLWDLREQNRDPTVDPEVVILIELETARVSYSAPGRTGHVCDEATGVPARAMQFTWDLEAGEVTPEDFLVHALFLDADVFPQFASGDVPSVSEVAALCLNELRRVHDTHPLNLHPRLERLLEVTRCPHD